MLLLGWRLEAIAIGLEAIAMRSEAIQSVTATTRFVSSSGGNPCRINWSWRRATSEVRYFSALARPLVDA